MWHVLSSGCLLALLLLLEAGNRLALWLDQLLFPGFRRVRIERPLFIMGPPRSGTTLMHRLIADDTEQFTTFPLWELLFAPAICQKRFWLAVYRLDKWIGGPLQWTLARLERVATHTGQSVHPTSLQLPEEDYLLLLPHRACFLLAVAFPRCKSLWRLSHFDATVSAATRRRLLGQYRALLQRHLYVRGGGKFFLSKNPCYSSWILSLAEEFPDARFVGLLRTPEETVPSQLSSIRSAVRFFGNDPDDPALVASFVDTFAFYYEHLARCRLKFSASHYCLVRYAKLKVAAGEQVESTLRQLGYEVGDNFSCRLRIASAAACRYRSNHRYALSKFGLTEPQLRERFGKVYQRLLEQSGEIIEVRYPKEKQITGCEG